LSAQRAKARVFLSYSRKDSAFTHRLAEALAARAYEPDFDQSSFDPANIATGISAEDEWWQRLQEMIAAADVMVFIVSPDSASSKACDEEIAYARGIGKRIIPVLHRPIDFAKAPPRLAALNIKIEFLDQADAAFDASVAELCAALDLDVDWHRENRRLTGLAVRWAQRERPDDSLLSAADVRAVGDLLEKRPRSAPEPSPLLVALRDRSRAKHDHEARLWRRMQAATGALLVGIIVGLVGWINQDALKERWHWYWNVRPYIAAKITPYLLSSEQEKLLKPGDSFRECAKDCPEMIVIAAGEFLMGSPDELGEREERPQHTVKFAAPLAVSKFEVTFDEWDECVSLGGCPAKSDPGWGKGRIAATNISWKEVKLYVAWFSRMTGKEYRLLSEAEWEYAARAGTRTAYNFGDDPALLCAHANVSDRALKRGSPSYTTIDCDDGYEKVAPVGSFPPNAFGLYDMHGNVWEWVEDAYHPNYEGAPSDGSAWLGSEDSLRVLRGGSWISFPHLVRSASRIGRGVLINNSDVGFRLARTLSSR
jgi:formylglycine-generating enzyme required for sulfatase activity